MIRRVIELARSAGSITFDQLDDFLSSFAVESEDIEALLGALRDEGISLVEDDPS
ncbi:RNA polymerase sigma factor region1.1 domain-containing protein [Bradyrhizobium sp. Arg237L]|uniref:RNA polymerase sigma factor region1.1 domain-containing protein n=1 Tax=Bradyrhizobium sp. Arg237L TaxID=3003352 RepID=UPI00249F5C94|nr:RNA polymerase sigma factor region1.1 domain-containing protein [Bradyrhizobium sp. Arg237L]MDI4239197.1 RNA polymerase sigma factor region1.1 domain-containing protein [Bradyrhizobium sp. Arg237L]